MQFKLLLLLVNSFKFAFHREMQQHFDENPQGLIWNTFSLIFFFPFCFPFLKSFVFDAVLFTAGDTPTYIRRLFAQPSEDHNKCTPLCSHIIVVLISVVLNSHSFIFFPLFRKTETSKSTTLPMWLKRVRRRQMPPSLSCSRFWDRGPLERWH